MPTDIIVTEIKRSVTVTGDTTSITVSGDTAIVNVATTIQPVNVVEESNSFTISTVTNKSDVGLAAVDNTSDLNKPISTATKLYVDTQVDNLTTAQIEEAGNLYYTQARVDARVAVGIAAMPAIDFPVDSVNGKTNVVVLTSSDIGEGTNLYYTTTRARASITGSGNISVNNTTGVISYTGSDNPTTTDALSEGTTNLYYTDARANTAVDTRLATKTTTNVAEGTNLYYTSSRVNSDFDTRLATKSTSNVAEGTNLYYTTTRGNTDFDTRLATKSTTDLGEGTNQYFTTARARGAVSGGTGITYTEATGTVAVDSTIATKSYADSVAASAAAAIVDSSPAALDTLNELAAALGDDPNFATTVATSLGNKLDTAGFGAAFDGQFSGKTTTDVTEGTNLYYTDGRARAAISVSGSLAYNSSTGQISYTTPTLTTTDVTEGTNQYFTASRARTSLSGGTGVTYDSGTGVVAIGQSVATTADVTFNTVNANITDDNFILGQIVASRNTAYVPPPSPLTTLTGLNGLVIASSNGGSGYGANLAMRYHAGDAGTGNGGASSITMSVATGTSTAPAGTATNMVPGTLNFDGYTAGTSNNYASTIATVNQGAGTGAVNPLQFQAYARQSFTNSTTVTTAVTGASGTGSVATLTFTTQNTAPYTVGQSVTIAGMTPSGYNGTYIITVSTTSSISYANATTGFTSGGTIAAANTVTAAGMGYRIRGFANSTVLTAANRFNFVDHTASAATYKSDAYTFANSVITGSTLTATNYMTLAAAVGSINQDTFTVKNTAGTTTYASFASSAATITTGGSTEIVRTATTSGANPALLLKRLSTATTTPVDGDGTGLRVSTAGSNVTGYGIGFFNYIYQTAASGSDHEFRLELARGDQTGSVTDSVRTISSKPTTTTIYAGTAGAAGVVSPKLTVDANKITAAVPVAFPVYTAATAGAVAGAVGWQISISDSPTVSGRMAFWDTTNARWSYISDNTAV